MGNENQRPSSNLDEAVYISLLVDALAKGMNPSLLPPNYGYIVEQTGFLGFGEALAKEKENSEFTTAILCFKIDFVSHPSRGEVVE